MNDKLNTTTMTTSTFETGNVNELKFVGDQNSSIKFLIVKRTQAFVWVQEFKRPQSEVIRKKVDIFNGVEFIQPLGKFSMSPILRADKLVA